MKLAFQPTLPMIHYTLTDVSTLSEPTREDTGRWAVNASQGVNRGRVLEMLNEALATEIVCVLRYRRHHFMARGIYGQRVGAEFLTHSIEEQGHADKLAARIVQLGGEPDFSPDRISARSHAEYVTGETLEEMIREDLMAERISIDNYRSMIRYLGNEDSITSMLLKQILAVEEEHADELASLLEGFASA